MEVKLFHLTNCAIVLLLSVHGVLGQNHDIYKGFSVYDIPLESKSQQQELHLLANGMNLDIWHQGTPKVSLAEVLVSPDNKNLFLEGLQKLGLRFTTKIEDVSTSLKTQSEDISKWKASRSSRLVPFEDYPRVSEVDAYLERIANEYPSVATLHSAGLSYEGRDIKYLKISTTNFADTTKPVYFMEALLHAREWVTLPVTLYSIHRLVEDIRAGDQDLVNDVDWIILPVANPDGYEYSHDTDRLWRKTRSINPIDPACVGVDGNRNFDIDFGNLGVSTNPCAITYPGEAPFSEPETRYIRDIILSDIERMQIFLDVHSYGQYVLFGYGNETLPSNAIQLHHMAATIGAEIDASKLQHADYYKVGNSGSILYTTSGSAQDYGQSVGVPFSYTLELPGYDYMFEVPPQYIAQVNEETWRGIAASARLAALYFRNRNN